MLQCDHAAVAHAPCVILEVRRRCVTEGAEHQWSCALFQELAELVTDEGLNGSGPRR
jgi:hypothetical protein